MLKTMNELDEIWQQMIRQAEATGNADVAEYLMLKANNDRVRAAGCQWLFDSFLELSEEMNRQGIRLEVENENPYRFAVGQSTMVGSLLRFASGVRSLSVEAGWTRQPADGFMRGNALAHARISHFGMSKANAELHLLRFAENAPQWFALEKDGGRIPFDSNDLTNHFRIFTNDF